MKFLALLFVITIVACSPVKADDKFLDIQEVTSKSGIKAWLVEDKSLPIISLKFSFKGAGAIHDGTKKQGLSQLLSNTMDEGAGDLSSQEFQKILSDQSITLSFSSGRDNFGGQLKTLSRNKEKAFNLLKLALTQPRFDEAPVERMRQANISRIRSSMGNPDWIAARLFNDKAFEGHAYALNSGGTLSSLSKITTDDLHAHVKNWLTKDRLRIGVMGDINPKELSEILDKIFGKLPDNGNSDDTTSLSLQNTGKVFLYNQDIPQTIISLALPSIKIEDPDYYALQVMNYIYGAGGFGSRLMEEIREKRGLTYGIYSSLTDQDYVDLFTISTSTKNESTAEVLKIVKEQMQKIKSEEVTENELSDSKSYITGSMPLSLASSDNISSILLNLQLDSRPIDYLDTFSNKINAVTRNDVKRVANRILDEQKIMTILVGKPNNVNDFITLDTLPNAE